VPDEEGVLTLGLSMIVKNEAQTLRGCLLSVSGLVSQIVVADTGSTDGTADIAREFGATVVSVPWENDFAKARNAALRSMETDWILVLDADEELDGEGKQQVPHLLTSNAGGFLVSIRNYIPTVTGRGWDRIAEPNRSSHPRAQNAPAYFVHENCRLFRRDPEIYFVGRVHELVEPRITAAKRRMSVAPFFIHHFGQLAKGEMRSQKAIAYRDLLRMKVRELPNDPMAWIQLGLQEYECSREPSEPLRCFERALILEPKATQAALFKGMVYLDLGKHSQALDTLDTASSDHRSKALREHLRGDALHNLGRLLEARAAYGNAIKLTGNDPVLSSKLGYTEVRLGRFKEGIKRLKEAAARAPEVAEIRERLMKAFVAANTLADAAEQAEELARLDGTAKAYLRAASIRVHAKQRQQARDVLHKGMAVFPDSADLRRAAAELEDAGEVQTQ
jgi:glycosyltransferase involved in cell wall biosynthesis/Tfp pilus assembly protein PilF